MIYEKSNVKYDARQIYHDQREKLLRQQTTLLAEYVESSLSNTYIEKIAREEYGMIKKGDIVYKIVPSSNGGTAKDTTNLSDWLLSAKKIDSFERKMIEFEYKVENISNVLKALREAIDPDNPEDILTIARLKDEVTMLSKELLIFQTSIVKNQTIFQDSIVRELETRDRFVNIIIVVLIPLVLNMLYTFWRDIKFRKDSREEKEADGTSIIKKII